VGIMTIDDIMYRGFLVVWKVLKQSRPNISNEERFIRAIIATSNDKFKKAEVLHKKKIEQLRRKTTK